MSGHTPGPWFQGDHPSIEERVYAQSQFIAECMTPDDAKLVAAAPDMLEALILAESYFGCQGFDADESPRAEARAAIAKATGAE